MMGLERTVRGYYLGIGREKSLSAVFLVSRSKDPKYSGLLQASEGQGDIDGESVFRE